MGGTTSRLLLRAVLAVMYAWLVLSSRLSARFRSQVTRSVTVEMGSDDGVSRPFEFDEHTRRLVLLPKRSAVPADCALKFQSAKLALSVLGSKDAPNLMLDGLAEGTIRFEGNPALFGWFQGLLGVLIARASSHPLPSPHRAPDRSRRHAAMITVEPPVSELDPSWADAVRVRGELAIWRVANGERPPRG